MMLLCGLATKNTPVFSELTLLFLQIGGNEPQYEEFRPRTLWSLSNAFTSAFKELDPIPDAAATDVLSQDAEKVRELTRRTRGVSIEYLPITRRCVSHGIVAKIDFEPTNNRPMVKRRVNRALLKNIKHGACFNVSFRNDTGRTDIYTGPWILQADH